MSNSGLLKHISFELSSVAHCRLGKEWNYKNNISSFTRLYLITEGEAFVYIGDRQILLRKGYLYLIPSFTHCSYVCPEYMEQYYATFTVQLPNSMSIYQLFNFDIEVKAKPYHFAFFKDLCDENPGMELPSGDPKIYQRMIIKTNKENRQDGKSNLRTSGLLSLFLSNFIGSIKMDLGKESHDRISTSIQYIHQHLNESLVVEELAERSYMSADHYTRRFKELTKQTPIDFINRQRVEKAQLMLNTTSLTCNEIAHHCGFKSYTYFCRIFKKYVHQSTSEYRKSTAFKNIQS